MANASHHNVFWSSSHGYYHDWIDIIAKKRSYFYTDHNLLAIIFGIATNSYAESILEKINEHYTISAKKYNITRSDIWSIPGNFLPIVDKGDMCGFAEFVGYENGGSFFHSAGFEILARSRMGYPDDAYDLFQLFMKNCFVPYHAWAQQLYWDSGTLVGWDPLNNSLIVLWGMLKGGFGFSVSLTEGITFVNKPAKAFEGAVYNFSYLGSNYCLTVKNGVTQTC